MAVLALAGYPTPCGHVIVEGSPSFTIDGEDLALVGISQAGGPILGPGAISITVDGSTPSVVGDTITPHGDGGHNSSTVVVGSSITVS